MGLFTAVCAPPHLPTLKRALLSAALLASSAGIPLLAGAAEHAVITIYHHIDDDTPASTSTSPAVFRQHLEFLRDNNFTVMPLDQLITAMRAKTPVPEKTVAISFDDGYISNYEQAFPMLKEFGFPFTLFINTGPLNRKQKGYLSWDQVREMAEDGALIAGHMVDHPHMLANLAGESDRARLQRIRQELLDSEEDIRLETGQSHRILAYPFGEYDPEVKKMVESEGFTAVAQHSGAISFDADFLAIPRFPLGGIYAAMERFPEKIHARPFSVIKQDPDSPVTADTRPALRLQLAKGNFQTSQLSCYARDEKLSIKWIDQEAVLFELQPAEGFDSRRWVYNCTAPETGADRYYWYSKMWIHPTEENRDAR